MHTPSPLRPLSNAILASLLLIGSFAKAQPRSTGCHISHNKVKPERLSLKQLQDIQNTIARSDTFDIQHYDITLDITDNSNQMLRASTSVIFTPKIATGSSITFDLFELQVDSVSHSSGSLTYSYDDELLTVYLPGIQVGVDDTVTVHYHGTPHTDPNWGGFIFTNSYIYNLGIGLTTIPPNFGKVWYPCFDSFVERASYAYHVKSAGNFRAHCQGEFMGETQLGGDTVVRHFELDHHIPTYCSAMAAADYVDSNTVHTGAYGNIPVRMTARPNLINNMVSKLQDVYPAIDALEHWYGPYDYDRVGYAITTQGALEITENIAYPSSTVGQSQFNNRGLLSHELGHMWWGNKVSPRVHNEMWLKEGPAEYAGHLVEEWAYGREAFVDVVKDNMLYVLEQAHVQDNGFHPMSPMPDPEIYGTHTYYKGAAMIHNLRGYLGDTLFRQAWNATHDLLADTAITAEDLRDALEATSGLDLDPFFEAWVWQPGYSVFVVDELESTFNGTDHNVDINVRQLLREAPNYHQDVPLDLTLVGADWSRQEYQVEVGGILTDVNLVCDFEPLYVVLNGHNRLNQARMDLDMVIRPGENFSSALPYVDFRLWDDIVADSMLMRIEHVWAGPEQSQIGFGIDEVSETHYWTVGGLWSDLNSFHGRIYYDANASTDLDWDLLSVGEEDVKLVYRATPQDPWDLYADYTANIGNTGDGFGYMNIDVLRPGHYAFAKGNAVIGIGENEGEKDFGLYPIPANDLLNVSMANESEVTAELFTLDGRLVKRALLSNKSNQLDVSDLQNGAYLLRLISAKGEDLGSQRIEVLH